MTADPPILELRDVESEYGPFRALFGVSLTVPAGGAVALLGANGAGKTTVARVASGLVSPSAGTIEIDGSEMRRPEYAWWTFPIARHLLRATTGIDFQFARRMVPRRTYEFAQAGVAHAPEGRSVFSTFTVEENLVLSFRRSLGKARVADALGRAYELFPRLGERRKQEAGTLSGGEQRMLSLARVLVEEPRLLVADELSLGLAPIVVDEVYDTLRTIRQSGTALLIVEQHATHALELCDRVALLEHGRIAWEGPSADAADVVAGRMFETGGTR